MNATDLFAKIRFIREYTPDGDIIWRHKTDYVDMTITFRVDLHRYETSRMEWKDSGNDSWVAMEERDNDFDKHCVKYGRWQIDTMNEVDMDLHSAIHAQCQELGWLNK